MKPIFISSIIITLFFSYFSHSLAQNTPASEVIQFDTECKVEGKNLSKKVYKVIKVNRREGEESAEIYIPYSKGDRITQLKVWIENEKGKRIRNVSQKNIEDVSAISDVSFYEDSFVKRISLVETKYPYYLHYSYLITYKQFLSIIDWDPIIELDSPTHQASLLVDVPKDYPLCIFENNIDSGEKTTDSKRAIYEWSANYTEQLDGELYAPTLRNFIPRVYVIPEAFEYGTKGSHKSWKTIGNWLYSLNDGLNNLPETEILKIKELTAGAADTKGKIKKLYHYLQDNTRYINVSMDIGGLKPYPAEYVAEKKYGDCKALTNYLKASLEVIDIPSFYTVIQAGKRVRTINRDFPSQQFNHVMLMVPIESDTLWLECTSNINPFDYMGTFTQNRDAFVIDENNSHLIRTPALQAEEVAVSSKVQFMPTTNGHCEAVLTILMKGPQYERFNSLQKNISKHDQDQIIKNLLVFDNYQVKDWALDKTNRDDAFITLTAKIDLPNYLKKYGNMLVAPLAPLHLPNFEKPKERTLPVQLDYPIYEIDTLIYDIPEGYRSKLMKSLKIENSYGTYQIDHELADTHVRVIRSFLLNAGQYPIEVYSQFYDFLQQVKVAEREQNVIFKQK